MKKIKLLTLLLIFPLLCSCGFVEGINNYIDEQNLICYDGIDSYSHNHGSYEINHNLLPSYDFLNEFEYIYGDYHHREKYKHILSIVGTETSLMVLTYEPEVYEEAKQYCIQEMMLSDDCIIEYNGYTFIENIKLGYGHSLASGEQYTARFPEWFNMLVYNDELNAILFLGCYHLEYDPEDKQEVMENFEDFLEENFNELYDFSADY